MPIRIEINVTCAVHKCWTDVLVTQVPAVVLRTAFSWVFMIGIFGIPRKMLYSTPMAARIYT
jgi:hypothetical protein